MSSARQNMKQTRLTASRNVKCSLEAISGAWDASNRKSFVDNEYGIIARDNRPPTHYLCIIYVRPGTSLAVNEAASNADTLGNTRKSGFATRWDFWEA
jgi:hypothetical protein